MPRSPDPPAVRPKRVALFVTCIVDQLYPRIGEAVVTVLERAGVEVFFPADQTCCGQPAFNAGYWDDAAAVARHTLAVLAEADTVVVPSGSCAAMIRHGYGTLFAGQPEASAAAALAARTFEFTEFLVDVLGVAEVGAHYPARVAVHDACHGLRLLGIKRQPRALLASVADAEFAELSGAEECCGFGGLFSVKLPQISEAMLQRKVDQIVQSGADVVVTCDASCMTQINGRLVREGHRCRAAHIAQLLETERRP